MRVLAVGSKTIRFSSQSELKNHSRDESERELDFLGFATFVCPLKPDSKRTVQQLKDSSHDVIMITGAQRHISVRIVYCCVFVHLTVELQEITC